MKNQNKQKIKIIYRLKSSTDITISYITHSSITIDERVFEIG